MKVLPGLHVSTEASGTRSRNVQVDVMTDGEVPLLSFASRSFPAGNEKGVELLAAAGAVG